MNNAVSLLCRIAAVLLAAGVPLRAGLLERWTFNDLPSAASGTTITGANGRIATIRGAGAISTGTGISLPGGSSATQAYIDLPNGLISPLTNLTVEAWVTLDTLQWFQRVFDFGSTTGGELTSPGGTAAGRDYIVLAPSRFTTVGANRIEFANDEFIVDQVDTSATVTLGTRHLFTYVWEQTGTQAVQRWYLDGVLAGQSAAPFTGALSQINDVNNWLGRSNYTQDANLDGTYDECAIYDHAMTATEIQARVAAGPISNAPPVYEKMFSFLDARVAEVANSHSGGSTPTSELVLASDGNLYGTTEEGGASGLGRCSS